MKKNVRYEPHGVCSTLIEIDTEDGIVTNLAVTGGCSGNRQGIANLVKGMAVEEVIRRLEGVDCKGRGTSCPDQISKALRTL